MKLTEDFESPRRFFYWSTVAAISAILKNKVWLDREPKLYPNIYVMCVAPSGVRKGNPISLATKLVREVGNTRLISGRNSIQAIIKELATTYTRSGQPPVTDACGLIASGEMSTVLIRDPEALTILTDLYDGHYNPTWSYTLKGSGKEELKGLGVSMLGAVNQTHLSDMLETKDITGGFMGRTLVVEEWARHCKNPFPHTIMDIPKLVEPLKEMARLEGPIIPTTGARELYVDWYNKYEPEKRPDVTGMANRMSDHIMKVAMVLAISRAPKLIIEKEDVIKALEVCSSFEQSAASVTKGKGSGEFAPKLRIFIDCLLSARGRFISRAEILSKHWGDFDAVDLERMSLTMEYSNAIKKMNRGKETFYAATETLLQQYGGFLERKEYDI